MMSIKKQPVQDRGLVIVYTGDGKGKTTAALGLALRATGYQKKILFVQFIKNSFSGELKSLKLFKSVEVIQGGKGFVGIQGDKLPFKEHQKAAKTTLKRLSREILSNKWDVIIADEIVGAVTVKLLSLKEVLYLMKSKPEKLDFILTGHQAPAQIIALADVVTEMVKIKHPFDTGFPAKKGIDY